MKRLLFALACIIALALSVAGAQTPAGTVPQSVPPPAGTSALSGVVKDADGTAVRRATVAISGDMRLDRIAVADDEGRFTFAGLPAGRFTITAKKAGYPERSYGARQPFRPGSGILLQDGQQVKDLVLTLSKGAVISGTAFDQRGEPMPGVPVMAWEVRTTLAGARTLGFAGDEPQTVITDDRGMYRLYGLAPGEYTIGTSWYYSGGYEMRIPSDAEIRAAFQSAQAARSGAPAPQPPAEPLRYSYSPTFMPGVVDPLSAATITLAAGQVREGADLRMQFLPMSEIVGTITAADGGPIDVELSIARRSPIEALNTMDVRPGQTDSKFSSGSISPGPYAVLAQSSASLTRPALWARADVMVSSGQPATVALVLQPALMLTGSIVFERTTLTPPKETSQVEINLRPAGADDVTTESKIDSAGALTVTGVIPGQYRVSGVVSGGPATGPWWSLKSVVADGHDVTDRLFAIDAGGVRTLTITFTDVTAELSGTLTTPAGAPATDYFLILMPADRAYWSQRTRRTTSTRPDRAGHYSFPRLPAGDYLVAVTTDLVQEDLRDVNALQRLAADAVRVRLGFGEQKILDLRTAVPANAGIARRLFPDGRPPASSRR